MRTTIRLEDALLEDLRRLAAETGRSMTSIIEDALREVIARRDRQREESRPVVLPVDGEGGLLPGVDLDDSASLIDRMDAPDDAP